MFEGVCACLGVRACLRGVCMLEGVCTCLGVEGVCMFEGVCACLGGCMHV